MKRMLPLILIVIACIALVIACNGCVRERNPHTGPAELERPWFAGLATAGLREPLDGWTFRFAAAEDDWRIDGYLQVYGARPIMMDESPDIIISDSKGGDETVIDYRGVIRRIPKVSRGHQDLVDFVVIEMAQMRLAELASDYGHRVKLEDNVVMPKEPEPTATPNS